MTDDQITLGTIGGVIGIVFGLIGGYSIGSMDLIEKKHKSKMCNKFHMIIRLH